MPSRFRHIATPLLMLLLFSGCGGGTDAGATDSSCDGRPEGAYQCSGNTGISVCKRGSWEYATSCTCTIYDGDPRKPRYASHCSIVSSSSNAVQCTFAFKSCMTCTPGSGCY